MPSWASRALVLSALPIAALKNGGVKNGGNLKNGGNSKSGGKKSGGGRKKKQAHGAAAVQQLGVATLPADTGARYRVRLVEADAESASKPARYLYQHGDAIVAHRAFFSLFRVEPYATVREGAPPHLLGDDAGGRWLTLVEPRGGGGARAKTRLAVGASIGVNGTHSYATPLWPRPATPSRTGCVRCFALFVNGTRTAAALGIDPADETAALTPVAAKSAVSFQLQPVVAARKAGTRRVNAWTRQWSVPVTPQQQPSSASASDDLKLGGERTFAERVRRCTTKLHERSFVLVTYHNLGMLDWASLFWQWLRSAGLRQFMLLELDGKTCDAARALNATGQLHFECATARDMASTLPAAYTAIKDASGMQEWGTNADSGYFKFLRWKMAIVEKLLSHGVDVLMADVDVLVLGPSFFTTLVTSAYDLTISSDARVGAYNDNPHCPCSHPMYQRFASDWVCAGLFYARSTKASQWFLKEVQTLMDEFVITDQDAIQAVLTGHTQVAVPQAKVATSDPNYNATLARFRGYPRGYRPSSAWLKPLWLEGLEPGQTLRNMRGIQPLNTPMRPGMWQRVSERRRLNGFTWATTRVQQFANGPVVIDLWHKTFSRRRLRDDSFASVHANCNVKAFLVEERNSQSFLLNPGAAVTPRPLM